MHINLIINVTVKMLLLNKISDFLYISTLINSKSTLLVRNLTLLLRVSNPSQIASMFKEEEGLDIHITDSLKI